MSKILEMEEKEVMVKVTYDVWMRNVNVSVHSDSTLTPIEVLSELAAVVDEYHEHPELLFEPGELLEPQ